MTGTMIVYSSLFMRFAWCVQPRNMILLACHTFNVAAQGNQLRRGLEYKLEKDPGAMDEIKALGMQAGMAVSIVASALVARKPVMNACLTGPSFTKSIAEMPAGPFYIHFWAPSSKWMLSVTNILDMDRPVEKISLAQTLSLTCTGVVWSRWSMVISPINYNLMTVNLALAATSGYQLYRKVKADYLT
jgi:mitochondrial pyruvate carrier 2